MEINNIIKELLKHDKREIEFTITSLMLENKLDFINVSNSYVRYLNFIKEDRLNQLIEAETCVLESFIDKKTKKIDESDRDYKHTQRCLYLMNKSGRFNINDLNNKYNYDEAFAKKMSWYERNKENE